MSGFAEPVLAASRPVLRLPPRPRRFAPAITPRPFLMVMRRHDEMCATTEAEHVIKTLANRNARLSFYDGNHKIGPAYVPEAVAWLKKHL